VPGIQPVSNLFYPFCGVFKTAPRNYDILYYAVVAILLLLALTQMQIITSELRPQTFSNYIPC